MTGRLALFVEGSEHPHTDPHTKRQSLVDLWTLLARRGGGAPRDPRVLGFSKAHLVALKPPPKWNGTREPLDILIAREHTRNPFDTIVIAFDAQPKHDGTRRRCWRVEVNTVINALCGSTVLPRHLREGAIRLRRHYRTRPRMSRGAGRPPRTSVDVLVMDPMFEDLLLVDEAGLKRVLEVPGNTRNWPSFRLRGRTFRPDMEILGPAIACASPRIHGIVQESFEDKHVWAEFVLRRLPQTSPVWQHGIVQRLSRLVG